MNSSVCMCAEGGVLCDGFNIGDYITSKGKMTDE
jgi:hypothetical protein